MRTALALCATLAFASAATAQTVEDRYGPPRAQARPDRMAALTPYQGRMLNWSSKEAGAPLPSASPPVAEPHAPLPGPAPTPPPPAAAPARPAVSRLPDSLYAPPPPAPPPAQRMAAAPPAAPAAGRGAHTRLYSVHREYGLAPDAIPAPPQANRYVLIGPPDGANARPVDDDTDASRPF